ncbi:hypothetical protein GUJ93_ZPchr0004g39395 [Zizania palustris]|uniref:Uncharacterized protein n=1 Tax=Zizania palustris TaxID=103762 RepID=A0A8J5S654_ZIZPA|nr:hypothetical protein GUJ93_ZPchr0004g39395 [Zizania palustris]
MLSKRGKIIAAFLLFVTISSTALTAVHAARMMLQGDMQYTAGHPTASLHERARRLLVALVAQLTAGPSTRGPGH